MTMSGCTTFQPGTPDGAIDVIAHRGASAYAPENTLAAFRLGHEMGADWFELDCRLSKDGEVVLMHDAKLERTTNGTGLVDACTLEELKALDAGAWKDAHFAGESVPTLAEALDFAKNRIGIYIEIKSIDDDSALEQRLLALAEGQERLLPDLAREVMALIDASGSRNALLTRQVLELIRERRMMKQVLICSFSPVACAVALIEAPDVQVAFIGSSDKNHPERWERYLIGARLLNPPVLNIGHPALTEEIVAELHRDGRILGAWTVDEEADTQRLAEWGVDAITSNRPDLCLEVLRKLGKHD